MMSILSEMFSYTFLVRAVGVGALVSVCAALLGVSLVLKRYSMIGDGLSHVGFGSLALATALHTAPLAVAIPVVIAAAFLLLRLSGSSKIKGDAAIALISTGSLAVGVVIISRTTGMNTDVCNYLFGSILAMNKTDVYLSIVLAVVVLFLFILFYHKLFAITFDETFAKAAGVRTGLYNMIIAFLTAITIVLGMRMMGAMLISSLIVFPALTSMRVFRKFKSVTICSVIVSVTCFFTGVVISYLYATPTGASIVIINIFAFLLFWLIQIFLTKQGGVKKAQAFSVLLVLFLAACGKSPESSFLEAAVRGSGAEAQASAVFVAPPSSGQKDGEGVENLVWEKSESVLAVPVTDPVIDPVIDPPLEVIEIREKMFIAQTNEIYLNTTDYLGKTIRFEGLFQQEQYEGRPYRYVFRYGPGCCGYDGNAGFEVSWQPRVPGSHTLPLKPYPGQDDWVRAEGRLETYEEEGIPYLYLVLSSLTVLDIRGAEFVTQ
ncbi:MAG: metal ABC transporter permease [Spirochaetales bacterium]|jgi:zinc transport system permease protein|nr:metal ABC transporter permease [Spirochaetales bacterium]